MAMPKIKPLSSRVLILPAAREEVTSSGIVLADTGNKERPQIGEVLAVGPGALDKDGQLIPMTVKVGQQVYFAKYGPVEVKVDDQEYLLVDQKDILAIAE